MEGLEQYLVKFGYMQLFVFTVASVFQLFMSMQVFALTFLVPNTDFWCARPTGFDVDVAKWRELSSPSTGPPDARVPDNCRVYKGVYELAEEVLNHYDSPEVGHAQTIAQDFLQVLNRTIDRTSAVTTECHTWEYDTEVFSNSMTIQFDLVCEKSILISTCNAISMVGYMVGASGFGYISDRFGRRRTALYSMLIGTVISTGMIFSDSFVTFMILRVFQSFFNCGVLQSMLVLFTELCSPKHIATMGNLFWVLYGVGVTLFAAVAYGLRDWQRIQMAISLPSIVIAYFLWYLPESPRWLLTKNRVLETMTETKKLAKWNDLVMPEDEVLLADLQNICSKKNEKQQEPEKKYSILDLFRWPHLRWKTLNLFFCCGVNAFLYFGMTFNTNQLAGDPFVNFAASGSVEVLGAIIAAIVAHYIGRRYPLMVGLVLAGLTIATSIFIPDHMSALKVVFMMLGKLFIVTTYCLVVIFSLETFPTVVRNIGFGSCNTVSAIASTMAPYLKELEIYTHVSVPPALFGILALVSGCTILLLPETKGRASPDSIEDALIMYQQGKKGKNKAQLQTQIDQVTISLKP